MFPAPCGAYNHHSQQPIMHNAFAMRHFSSDSSEKDKDKEKDKAIVAKEKKPSKFEYYKKVAADMVRSGAYSTYLFFRHPTLIPGKLKYTWGVIKEEAHHYHVREGWKDCSMRYSDNKLPDLLLRDLMFLVV